MTTSAVVLTGHAGGIGSALAEELSERGYQVIGIDRNPPEAFRGVSIPFDIETLADPTQHARLASAISDAALDLPITALINNAAVQHVTPLREAQPEQILQAITVNTLAPVVLFQLLRTQLLKNQGTVLTISSIHTRLTKPAFGVYAMSKCATSSLSRTLSIEEGERIRIIEVNPGAVATKMLEAGFHDQPAKREQLDAYQPLGRIATPGEVAQVCVGLLSMEPRALNGTVVNLDGGISAVLHDPS